MLQKGDKIFFAENSKESAVTEGNYSAVFYSVASAELGLFAVFYNGASLEIRNSSLDCEMRDDLYGSRAAIIYLGEPLQGSTSEDNWLLQEIQHGKDQTIHCLVYVGPKVSSIVLENLDLNRTAKMVNGADEFASALRRDLQSLMR